MSWKMIGKPKVTRVERSLVDKFATMTPAPGDRHLSPKRAARIRHLMGTGQFRTCEWASVYCEETGETYRVNGKHTSTMLAEMNGTMPKNLFVTLSEYNCDTLDDVARLYATFDSRDSIRSTGDINRSFAGTIDGLSDIPARTVNVAVSGLSFEKWEESYTNLRPEERAALLLEHANFVLWLDGVFGCSPNQPSVRHIGRCAVVAAMARTFFRHQKSAGEFWEMVRDGSGSDHRAPDRVLHRFLLTHTNTRRSSGKPRAGDREIYVRCIHAWNAWRKGTATDLKYYHNAETPKAV